jgi:hypothetical protein
MQVLREIIESKMMVHIVDLEILGLFIGFALLVEKYFPGLFDEIYHLFKLWASFWGVGFDW